MAINIGIELVLLPLSFLIFLYIFMMWRRKTSLLTNWPLVGMTPSMLMNAHRIHDFTTCILRESNLTFQFIGPMANLNSLWTSDPANINHIFSKNFTNYSKGPDFVKIFDILGDGILSADGHLWEVHRRTTISLFNHAQFYQTLEKITKEKLEKGLVPMFDHVSKHGTEVDLLDIFQRLNCDNICTLLLDYDPQSLSLDLPYDPFHQGLMDGQEALLYRHVLPESIWKLQRWIGFGTEKKLIKQSLGVY
ncbi:hypothetical protein POM88_054595 [Heracleum sosnowskyi]|uniref:Cytochrome P450 n=1 Tax=Heracleum sosnowskyi TaxID=360622 RepID=A0AAD8LWP8_9APIA|nr:hypothetical protein POM88_054595 [Heracleum sosnowskyi]